MGDGRDRFAEQALRSRRRVRSRAIANRDIRIPRSQIDHAVVGRHPDVDLGMALLEAAKARQDP